MIGWYKLVDKKPVPIDINDPDAMAEALKNKRVALTELPNGGRVSTVFLGLDHSHGGDIPVLFETMVFPRDSLSEQDMARYHTWDEAVEGHKDMVLRHGGTMNLLDEDLFQV
jgi:hypothetical protein